MSAMSKIDMIQKFVIEVEEMSADYEENLIGGTTDSHRLLFFDTETEAEDVEVDLAESQDCDRKVAIKRIGWVDVPACFRELDDTNCFRELEELRNLAEQEEHEPKEHKNRLNHARILHTY